MPIVQKTKYKTSDGKLFDSEKSAIIEQDKLNNSSLASFNNEVYNKYIKSWADGRFDKETIDGVPPLSTLIKGIINKNLDRKLVDDALTTLFLYYSRQLIELAAQTAHAKEEAAFPIAGEKRVLEVAKKV